MRRRRETLWAYAFLAPGFLLFALVILYPIARAFQISLYNWSIAPGQASTWLGLHNYNRALHDPIFWRALVNTAFYMAVTTPVQVVLGLAVAVLLDARMPARGLFRALYYLPVVTSWVVVSLLFRYLFMTDGGLVNWLTGQHVDWLGSRWTAMTVVSILGVWKGIGWSMVIFLAALQGVPQELKEAAMVDGARGQQHETQRDDALPPRQHVRAHAVLPLGRRKRRSCASDIAKTISVSMKLSAAP